MNLQFVEQSFAIEQRRLDRYIELMFKRSEAFKADYLALALDNYLTRLVVGMDGEILNTYENARILEEMVADVPIMLENAGLSEYVEDLLRIMRKRIDTINFLVNKLGLDASKLSREQAFSIPTVIDCYQKLAESGMQAGYRYQPEIAQVILDARITINNNGASDYKAFLEQYNSKVGTIPRYIGTVAGTMLARMDRMLRREQARMAGIEHGKYVGPVDAITRPYCRHTVGLIKTWEEWDKAQNDVGPQPVSEWGGGWNCRHAIIFYDKSWE